MSKARKAKRSANPPSPAAAGRRIPGIASAALAIAIVAAAGLWWSRGRHAVAPPAAAPSTAIDSTNQPASAPISNSQFERLKGKWLRPDGGYVVEIRSVEPDGKMDAAYFNPTQINVAKAVALKDGQALKIFIELRDVNYPGSTYTLAYQPENDQLVGIYYQAATQQRFDVFFERMR